MRILAEKDQAAVSVRVQAAASKQDVLSTANGHWLYDTNCGNITAEWRKSVATHEFHILIGANADSQRGRLQDDLLHEAGAFWLGNRL